MRRIVIVAIVAVFSLSGCKTIIDSAVNRAGRQIGNAIGQKVGDTVGTVAAGYADAMLRELTPGLMNAYAMSLFSVMYHHGGFWLGDAQSTYKPGEYTKWKAPGSSQGDTFSRAYLKNDEDGNAWWRVEASGTDDDGKTTKVVMEALFAPAGDDGVHKIVRMRALFPDKTEPEEVPITEENQSTWILRPRASLTKESIDGATVGKETLYLQSGKFDTKHVRYGSESSVNEWWIVESGVPGNVVQYAIENKKKPDGDAENERVVVELQEHGSGESDSVLGSF